MNITMKDMNFNEQINQTTHETPNEDENDNDKRS